MKELLHEISEITDWLSSQSDSFISAAASAADWTCWIRQTDADKSRLEPTVLGPVGDCVLGIVCVNEWISTETPFQGVCMSFMFLFRCKTCVHAGAHIRQICTHKNPYFYGYTFFWTHQHTDPQKYNTYGCFMGEEVLTKKQNLSTLCINAQTQFSAQYKQNSYVLISGLDHTNGDKPENTVSCSKFSVHTGIFRTNL